MVLEIRSETDRIFCHFGPFFTLSSLLIIPKIKILRKKWNKCLEMSSSDVYMCTINEDHTIYGSWNIRWNREIFVILGHFLPFQFSENLEHQNLKIEKNTWRYYHFTHLHHKWQSYDVWFLRYGAWQTEFFVILDHFLPFCSPIDPENQNF